jgi:hypothetical protein
MASGVDLDVIVLASTTGACDPTNAIAYINTSGSFVAEAGVTYYLVVEGYGGSVGDYTLTVKAPVCGNEVIEPGEQCDGTNLAQATCVSLDQGFTGGALACTACAFDTSGCTDERSSARRAVLGCGDVVTGNNGGPGPRTRRRLRRLHLGREGPIMRTRCGPRRRGGHRGAQRSHERPTWTSSCCLAAGLCDPLERIRASTQGSSSPKPGPPTTWWWTDTRAAGDYTPRSPVPAADCGNGTIETGEECDGRTSAARRTTPAWGTPADALVRRLRLRHRRLQQRAGARRHRPAGEDCDRHQPRRAGVHHVGLGFVGGALACSRCAFDTAAVVPCAPAADLECGTRSPATTAAGLDRRDRFATRLDLDESGPEFAYTFVAPVSARPPGAGRAGFRRRPRRMVLASQAGVWSAQRLVSIDKNGSFARWRRDLLRGGGRLRDA